jgi:arylsulfatase A-like enzyme
MKLRSTKLGIPAAIGLSMFLSSNAHATNYLIFLIDDLGNSKVSSYEADYTAAGYAPIDLPDTQTMDLLATRGLRFARAWSSPLCSPSRASLQTGRQPYVHGVGYPLGTNVPELVMTDHQMLADSFADAGYDTGLFGKWHVALADAGGSTTYPALSPFFVAPSPVLAGWQRFYGALGGDIGGDFDTWARMGWVSATAQGFVGTETVHATKNTATNALNWINGRANDPFIALVAFHAPHSASGAAGWTYADVDSLDLNVRTQRFRDCIDGVLVCNQTRATYAAQVEFVDLQIERILNNMDPAVLEDTLVIVMGDNGTPNQVQEAPFNAAGRGKGSAYESGVRVPLIIADGATYLDPNAAGDIAFPGTVIRAGVHMVDVYQTLHEHAFGYNVLAGDGEDFTDCFSTNDIWCNRTEQYHYAETFRVNAAAAVTSAQVAVRHGHDKMVATYDAANNCMDHEYYDTRTDQFETAPQAWGAIARGLDLQDYFLDQHAAAAPTWASALAFCP